MKITFLVMGRTEEQFLREGIDKYVKRLSHYTKLELIEHHLSGKTTGNSPALLKEKEAEIQLKYIGLCDYCVLLDERGHSFTSVEFAGFVQQQMNRSVKRLLFIAGGAWGFEKSVYQKADFKLSLSAMTFSHQMVRLFFVEQLYRAFSILRNEAYHNA
ncbi:MAG TPA: 23S rRNA (pseudouridine(1915)-N(3))-methyltransferase RlmH [Bacteroidales bacterium]|nr:23S rRNA (pseudouridine(1915)-N(3))-methyltransferase RlmH [Bacteroidales bacterium]